MLRVLCGNQTNDALKCVYTNAHPTRMKEGTFEPLCAAAGLVSGITETWQDSSCDWSAAVDRPGPGRMNQDSEEQNWRFM